MALCRHTQQVLCSQAQHEIPGEQPMSMLGAIQCFIVGVSAHILKIVIYATPDEASCSRCSALANQWA